MPTKRRAKQVAPMIRGAFIRAVKALEDKGKPLSEIIMKELESKPLDTLRAISSFVPKELLLEADITTQVSEMTEDVLNAEIRRLVEQSAIVSSLEGEGTQTQH